ncbi:guanitoxin biosynthesis L-enduracididine beta-hydroxylase GntD [Streptomyces sp. VNUA116]|uniref:guanitoxin biosynthesis L-enduracididine beta-hydroxylase GntD n=1 Tax=Streptomyces sp. VNUA116 TaxID=3062449 RepID=UPI002675F00D|nr:guanitoxin biosynthesis L-enduracididine beta-hydroxylase GntD [Streptomyces sp. VNUA116]WKU48220.1 guanitoxin biosynthesis L-enduracididine beta-hydroxylase GntD [Streptomyces sp. VNUA116]
MSTAPTTSPTSTLPADRPASYTLGGQEAARLQDLVADLRAAHADPSTAAFYDSAWRATALLPDGLRHFLEEYRRGEHAAACLVHGFPVDDSAVGPTPGHWSAAVATDAARDQELMLALCGMVLGEPFGWATLQGGSLVQNVLPIRGDEDRQSGYGSGALLEFHTEDGFHPQRCDYLMLFGLRNADRVPTIVASVRDVELSGEDRRILAEERFHIFPDTEHIRQLEARDPAHPALAGMRRMLEQPRPEAVLFGDRLSPYLRIDRPFMRAAGGDARAEAALDRLMAELERVQQDVVVGPGTLLVVDNYLAAHGRRSFTARYDGTDRWLKKLTVSRNLRRGLGGRAAAGHRVLV